MRGERNDQLVGRPHSIIVFCNFADVFTSKALISLKETVEQLNIMFWAGTQPYCLSFRKKIHMRANNHTSN